MPNFDRFLKRWASTGVVTNPGASQADTGFSFLADKPPTIELFNALFQILDDKDNWLYLRISEVLLAAGIQPSDATQNQLLTAMRTIFAPGMMAIQTSQAIIVPAGVTRMKVRLWGGGGGGGGSIGGNSAGGGGGGGGFSEGIFPVSPNASIFVTVGAGGAGAPGAAIYTAQAGGTTSFGSFSSATGGTPGGGAAGGAIGTAGTGGSGVGGIINLDGVPGGFGQTYAGTNAGYSNIGGGIGGSSPFGGGLSTLSIGAGGNPGIFPGGGGTGAGSSNGGLFSGGSGAPGFAILEW